MRKIMSGIVMLALVLALALAFSGCSKSGNTESESYIKPLTVTITTVGNATSAAAERVQAELNRITESKYNTHVVLNIIPEDKYEDRLAEMMLANDNGEVQLGSTGLDEEEFTEVTEVDSKSGRIKTVYPSASKDQLDIFLVPGGWAKFKELGDDGYLSDLSSYLSDSNGALLKTYIPDQVIKNYCRVGSSLYGIPSNVPYGDCEFLLVNKEILANYNYSIDEFVTSENLRTKYNKETGEFTGATPFSDILGWTDLQNFLLDVSKDIADGKVENVTPLYNFGDMCLVSLTGSNSAYSKAVYNTSSITDGSFKPLYFLSEARCVQPVFKLACEINLACGIVPTTDASADLSEKFAAGFVRGDLSIKEKYADDYYIIQTRVPIADNEAIYGGMYAVSSYAEEYSDRCMQIITCMNTNKEFRNLLAYGIENLHYIINEDTKLVTRTSDDYKMDIYKSGNVFLLMQNDEMTEDELTISANDWELAKKANSNAVISPYAKFKLNITLSPSGTVGPRAVEELAAGLEAEYDNIITLIKDYPDYIDPTTGQHPTVAKYLNEKIAEKLPYVSAASASGEGTDAGSIGKQYNDWYVGEFGEGE